VLRAEVPGFGDGPSVGACVLFRLPDGGETTFNLVFGAACQIVTRDTKHLGYHNMNCNTK
jgi:hypothetical protein